MNQHSKISLSEKALQQFNDLQRDQAMKEREQKLQKQLKQASSEGNSNSSPVRNNYLGFNLETMGEKIPGFQMIKDRVLKPMLVATEKVVEYYMKEDEVPNQSDVSGLD